MAVVFGVILVLTVWPGVWLTDSMIRSYFTSYDYKTWMWYLPLTAPFVPWMMWSAWRRSRASALEEAVRLIERVRELTDGQTVAADGTPRA